MKPHQSVQLTASRLEIGYSNDFILTIDNLALTGNIIALAGHNGAGKSTFMKGLLGLLPMRSGTLSVTDTSQSIHLLPEQHMAFCPESGSVFADITVAEYLALWCRLKRRNARYLYEEGKELIEFLEIGPLLKRKGRELSKGQKQRVQTAAGFFSNPKLFLFDEPFDGLDVQRTHELMQLIREKSVESAFIISSHRMDVIERLADHTIVLEHGRVKTSGETSEVSRALCGNLYLIENATNPKDVLEKLALAYPNAFMYLNSGSIRLIAPDIDRQALSHFVSVADGNGAYLTAATPTLTDAMSFHLKELNVRRAIPQATP